MPDQKIVDYIKAQLVLGVDRNKIKSDLMMIGSLPSEIDAAFNSLNTIDQVVGQVPTPPNQQAVPAYSNVAITENKKSSSSLILWIIIILLIVLVGGYFSYSYYKGNQNPIGQNSNDLATTTDVLPVIGGDSDILPIDLKTGTSTKNLIVATTTNPTKPVTSTTTNPITNPVQTVTYSVIYDGNGNTEGSVPLDTKQYAAGSKVTVLGNTGSLARVGFTFAGWNTLATGLGTDRPVASVFTSGSVNVILYAKWAPNVWIPSGETGQVKKVYRLNGYTGAVTGTYPVDAKNQDVGGYGIAVDVKGNVWVAFDDGTDGSSVSNLSKYDGKTGAIIGTYLVGNNPHGVAVDNNGNIWTANYGDQTVTKINGSTGAVIGTYSVGNNPYGVAADSSGNIWVALQGENSVSKIDSSTGKIINTYNVGESPHGIAVDENGNVWVANYIGETVSKINVSSGVVSEYPVSGRVEAVAVDKNGNVWVTDSWNRKIYKINNMTGNITGTYNASAVGIPSGVAVDDAGSVWIGNSLSLFRLTASTGKKVGEYFIGTSPDFFGDATGFALRNFVLK